jgi:hypothetical protein
MKKEFPKISFWQIFNMNVVFLLNANVPSDGKSKGTLVVNTGKITGAFLIMSYINVSM